MIIESFNVTKLRIHGAERLDPIDAYLEDVGPRAGVATLTCFGESWTAYWGAMGNRGVAQFLREVSVGYLVNCFKPGMPMEIYDQREALAIGRRAVLRRRRSRDLSREEAGREYLELDDLHMSDDPWHQPDVMQRLLGDEWQCCLPMKPNPDCLYLTRIVVALQAALALAKAAQREPVHG